VKNILRKGALLYADPSLQESPFRKSVIAIIEHNHHGTTGIIINKPIELSLDSLILDEIPSNINMYYGGPVGQQSIFYLHNKGNLIRESHHISEGTWWGGNFEIIKDLLNNQMVASSAFKFFIGYSGWGAGQLLDELEQKAWILGNEDLSSVLQSEDPWKMKMQELGGRHALWASLPEEIHLN
jgi:putative transcriptional regulator